MANDLKFDKVRMVIGDPNRDLRSALSAILRQHGFNNVVLTGSFDVVKDAVDRDQVDLLVCDAELGLEEGRDFSKLVSNARHGRLGGNPFIVIQTLIESPTAELMNRISVAGVDDIVLKPITAGKVAERIMILTKDRKDFVVTTDYVGPDRRSKHRPGTQEIKTLEVPNPVLVRASGGDVQAMEAEIRAAMHTINEQKVERHAFQIDYLVNQILPGYQEGVSDKKLIPLVEKLALVAKDIGRRLKTTQYEHVGDLCVSVFDVAVRIRRKAARPDHKDLELLPNLAMAINLAFKDNQADIAAAHNISESVKARH